MEILSQLCFSECDYADVVIILYKPCCSQLSILYCTVLYCTVLYCTVLYSLILFSPILSCPVLPQISKSFHQSLQIISNHDRIRSWSCFIRHTVLCPTLPFIPHFVLLCYLFFITITSVDLLYLYLYLYLYLLSNTYLSPSQLPFSYLIFALLSGYVEYDNIKCSYYGVRTRHKN